MKINKYFFLLFIIFILTSCQIQSKKGIIISKLNKASKLSTVEVVVTKYIYNTEELRTFFQRIFKEDVTFLSKTEATIKLGVDLSKITAEDINIRGSMIEIELPAVEIINFSYPAEKFEVDTIVSDFKFSKINKTKANKIDKLYQAGELEIWQNIDKLGLHKTVEDKTKKLINKLLNNMGFDEVYITFKERKPLKFRMNDPFIDSLIS
jgi:hypothetical protein